jgi:DNA (cytosine-5)-methyltransferase 1
MSVQKKKTAVLQLRIDSDLSNRFSSICAQQRVSLSSVLRQLIVDYCNSPKILTTPRNISMKFEKRLPTIEASLDSPSPSFSIGEMYSGPGGLGLGAKKSKIRLAGKTVGYSHKWATDFDPDTCKTFANNISEKRSGAQIICSDVRELDLEALPTVDGFLYGFPCNDFSIVGESRGLGGDFGPLYKYGVDYINHHNPLFFLAENVSGLSSANAGDAFIQILRDLGAAGRFGYEITVNLYKFEEFGIPQARHRIIAVGMRKDLGLKFRVPKPSGKMVTSKEAIVCPPIPPDAPNHELTRQSAQVVERLELIAPGENAWTANLPERLQLNVKGARLSQIYKRLDPDKPSYTVTGSGGGGTHVYHWDEPRALTNRERARLQTFPDDFIFFGSKESVRKQIGMAVPPAGAQIILTAVLKTLCSISYSSIDATFPSIKSPF